MTKAIYKCSLQVKELVDIELPKDAQIIRVSDIDGLFFLWAIVDTSQETEKEIRHLELYKTGQPFKSDPRNLKYLGECKLFIMQELGLYVFERLS